MFDLYVVAFIAVALCVAALVSRRRASPSLPLPPGPPGKFLIGNVLDIPHKNEALVFHDMSRRYGDIFHLKALGTRMVVLCSAAAIEDVLEKRASISTHRTLPPMAALMGFSWLQASSNGERWRKMRRTFQPYLSRTAMTQWQPEQLRQAHLLVKRLLLNPSQAREEIRLYFASSVMSTVYGIDVVGAHDQHITDHEKYFSMINQASIPGNFLVDIVPILKHVPSWFPGAGFQRLAVRTKDLGLIMNEHPLNIVKHRLGKGLARPSIASGMLESLDLNHQRNEEDLFRDVCGGAYVAGLDTTQSTVMSFILAVLHFPDVQARAHAELDAIVDQDRLPEYADRAELPYLNAIVSETLRWMPPAPLALPHTATEDMIYGGYVIPKDTLIIGNAWSLLHDPVEYPEPEAFKPERFLRASEDGCLAINTSVRDPRTAVFGWGRRACQGRYLAEQQLFIAITLILAVFEILPQVDESGQAIIPPIETTSGITSQPVPFPFVLRPRSSKIEALVDVLE